MTLQEAPPLKMDVKDLENLVLGFQDEHYPAVSPPLNESKKPLCD
jgi:hypothetical protein